MSKNIIQFPHLDAKHINNFNDVYFFKDGLGMSHVMTIVNKPKRFLFATSDVILMYIRNNKGQDIRSVIAID